jgi:hypothetical protein
MGPREHSPEHSNVATATIHDRTALYISIFSMVLSALCLGLFLMQTFLMPQIIDAKIQAGVAKSAEEAHTASVRAQLAERDLSILREALQRKGFVLPPKD